MNLEKAIVEAIASQLVVGAEYQTEYGTQVREAALTPFIRSWFQDKKTEIVAEVIQQVGADEIKQKIVEAITAHLSKDSWDNYKWKDLIKETAPLVAEKVALKMYDDHKKDICELS